MSEHIIKAEFSEVMQKSYIDYAMSVICARALPDARDGLKPVQRRVLYSMDELGLRYDRPHRKSARIVGDTMGKYHPHGDSSIYESLVVMSQDFKKGVPLVDGHGNFGSIEGDGAAAMRYTEARLQKITQEAYLADLDKNVVDFVSNFDETEKEPEVLPVKVPNLLVNGADGIAVGMTTSIPPHNLGEVVDAVKAYMRKESITNEELMEYIEGPDFPTGGLVINKKDLLNIYSSGTGKLKLRGKVTFESAKKRGEKDKLVISEIPYTMIGNNISKFLSEPYREAAFPQNICSAEPQPQPSFCHLPNSRKHFSQTSYVQTLPPRSDLRYRKVFRLQAEAYSFYNLHTISFRLTRTARKYQTAPARDQYIIQSDNSYICSSCSQNNNVRDALFPSPFYCLESPPSLRASASSLPPHSRCTGHCYI